jgi:hypothetical protein
MSRVSQQISELHFVAQPAERVYLNEERAHDHFTGLFGAISQWIAKASREGTVKLGALGVGLEGALGRGDEVTFDITDPVAQAMVMRRALEDQGRVKAVSDAEVHDYVVVAGESCLRHPAVKPQGEWHTTRCEPTEELEAQRADAELFHKVFNSAAMVWLLMVLINDERRAAGVLDQKWLNDQAIPRWFHRTWTTFGVLQDRIGDVPLIAPIAVFVHHGASSTL